MLTLLFLNSSVDVLMNQFRNDVLDIIILLLPQSCDLQT